MGDVCPGERKKVMPTKQSDPLDSGGPSYKRDSEETINKARTAKRQPNPQSMRKSEMFMANHSRKNLVQYGMQHQKKWKKKQPQESMALSDASGT